MAKLCRPPRRRHVDHAGPHHPPGLLRHRPRPRDRRHPRSLLSCARAAAARLRRSHHTKSRIFNL
jgi:hypothetical protein